MNYQPNKGPNRNVAKAGRDVPHAGAAALPEPYLLLIALIGLMFIGTVNCAATAPPSSSAAAAMPALPQKTVDVALPTQTGRVQNVNAGDATGFQNAINKATCGDVIVLAAGSTYSGNFVIPATSCSGWIEITSSALALLPARGNRVGPANAPNMAKISAPNTNAAIQFFPGANHWRLMGLEITTSMVSTVGTNYSLVTMGVLPDGSGITVTSQLPAYIIFDRVYLHGLANTNTKRGIEMDAQFFGFVDSYCDEIHYNANDSQCLASWNGAGPFLIQNNFIQAGAEDIMFGGSVVSIPNLIPADITIVGNVIRKNPEWRNQAAPYNWVIKNLLELKCAERVLLDGNVLEYSWLSAQVGYGILLTPRGGSAYPWCGVQDVTITHNLVRHVGGGIEIAGADTDSPSSSLPSARILVQNNLFEDVSSVHWGGTGWVNFLDSNTDFQTAHDIIIDHNTSFPDNSAPAGAYFTFGDSGKNSNVTITNNLSNLGAYGIFGSGVGSGAVVLKTYINTYTYNHNVFMTVDGASQATYSPGTAWSTQTGVRFAGFAAGNYQLSGNSPYHNAGSDARDVGVWDWTCLNYNSAAALAGKFIPRHGCTTGETITGGSSPPEPPSGLSVVIQ
jgi:hypothetical protein